MRDRLRPWTRTTVPLAPSAGTHQPESGTPSRASKDTSSKGRENVAGVTPSFSASFIWNVRTVKTPARK